MRQSDADTGRRQKWTESISARVKSGVQPRAVARRLNVVTPVLIPLTRVGKTLLELASIIFGPIYPSAVHGTALLYNTERKKTL